ncbi:MAG: hypothetical protein ACJAR1_000374 [Rubritalea sp.]|jgi:hypothetical protein
MDLSVTYPTFFRNLKFWGFHTLINSIPSVLFAYMDGRDTIAEFIAVFIGIILFTVMLTFFMSMKDVHSYRYRDFVDRAVKAGIRFRFISILVGIIGTLGIWISITVDNQTLAKLFSILYIGWAPDLILGYISNEVYGLVRFIFGSSRNFIPTIMIIMIQGLLLFSLLIASGILFVAIGLGTKNQNSAIKAS